jgi:hypothetical protein
MTRLFAALICCAALAGCATQAPTYQASIDNVEALRRAQVRSMQVGAVSAAPSLSTATSISMRGNPMSSPVGASYADYLAAALRQELEFAKLLDPKAAIEVSAVLLKNDIDAGIGTGTGEIGARFAVKRDGTVRYEATKSATLSWESSFAAAIALPAAQQNYPRLVQKLLTELFTDAAFIAACK